MSQNTELLKSLRTTLRHLRRLPSTSSSSTLKLTITNHIRNAHHNGNAAEIERAHKTMAAYAESISSVQQLNHLRGLDTGEKMTQSERVKAMASRVGLGTPQEYTADAVEDEEEEAKSK